MYFVLLCYTVHYYIIRDYSVLKHKVIYTLFYKNVIFRFRLKTSKKISISASKNFLFFTFCQVPKLLYFSYFLQHISTSSNIYNLYTYSFKCLIVWCNSFSTVGPLHHECNVRKADLHLELS